MFTDASRSASTQQGVQGSSASTSGGSAPSGAAQAAIDAPASSSAVTTAVGARILPPRRPTPPGGSSSGSSSPEGGSPGGGPANVDAAAGARPLLTLEYLVAVGGRVRTGQFAINPTAEAQKVSLSAMEAAGMLGVNARAFATNNKTNMLGVQPEIVLGSMILALIAARESGNIVPFLKDMILGANLGPTVARSHVNEYRALDAASMYRQFEIADREWVEGDERGGDWVANCDMNATAVRWVGLILYTFANQGSFLAKVAAKTGTILNPPVLPPRVVGALDQPVTREELLVQAAGLITPAFRMALNDARPLFVKTMAALDEIYGDAGPELGEAIAVANRMADYEI